MWQLLQASLPSMADSKPGWVPAGVKSMAPFEAGVDFDCEAKFSGFEPNAAKFPLSNVNKFESDAFECAEVNAGDDNCVRCAL